MAAKNDHYGKSCMTCMQHAVLRTQQELIELFHKWRLLHGNEARMLFSWKQVLTDKIAYEPRFRAKVSIYEKRL